MDAGARALPLLRLREFASCRPRLDPSVCMLAHLPHAFLPSVSWVAGGRVRSGGDRGFPVGVVAVAGLVLLLLYGSVRTAASSGARPADLHIFWLAGRAYLHGMDPYPSVGSVGRTGGLFVYPAPMAALFAPLGWMPFWTAALVWETTGAGAVLAALRLLGVRDVRCVVLAFLSFPVLSGISVGTVSPLLLLAVVALWKWRDREFRAGMAVSFLLVSKLFLWPFLVWLVATRRYRAAAYGVLTAAVLTLAAWAPIGFEELGSYPAILRKLALVEGPDSYQPVWLLPGSGDFRLSVLEFLAAACALALIALGRRLRDRASFRAAILVSLAVSPIVWTHYLVLLLPLLGTSLSLTWVFPLVFWASPDQLSHGQPWRVALEVGVVAATALAASRGRTHWTGPSRTARQSAASRGSSVLVASNTGTDQRPFHRHPPDALDEPRSRDGE